MEGDGFVAKVIVDKFFGVVVPRNDDGDLLVLDELEFFGGGAVVEEKGEVFFPRVLELRDDVFGVPLRLLLVVVFVEVGLDGGGGEWIFCVEVEDFVSDACCLSEIALRRGVFGVEDVGLSVSWKFALAVTAASGLGDGVESCHGAVDEREVDIDSSFDELGGDEEGGEFVFETLADG